ncbi:AAA family ATPase [bacterium]|nr:AAA family ATPase [bacterium]
MHCSSCGAGTIEGQKFCGECGAALAAVCPSCGESNTPGHKFCAECGTPLGSTASAPVATASAVPSSAARRFVTVLFADLVGFTAFSEGRDPEEVRDMLTRYFDRSREIVERYAGEVDKFIGDAVMAVWGAVEAHEDDAERAVRAALELVDATIELGAEIGAPDLRLRAGVLTGETSVGPGGNEKGLVVGDMVNTASRLQSLATPGTVFVGESTRDLVRDVVEFEDTGTHRVKGKEAGVRAYRAVRVIAGHAGRGQSDMVEPPFVGRDEELRLLKDQVHAVGRDRRGRLVSVIGEGGIGKSRLAWELFKYLDGLPEVTYWHRGRSPSYADGLTFWALGEMVRQRAGIAALDDPAKSRMKLRTALTEYVPEEDDRRWLEPWLSGLLGLDPMPEGDRAELFAALRTLFLRVADLGQTVLVFEDLHWADDGLLDFIAELVERSGKHPILVIALFRPDLLDRHPSWASSRRHSTSVRLAPLADGAMTAMVEGMVPGIPGETVVRIVDRAAGIPLYAVEFVRMLIGTGDVVREGDDINVMGDIAALALPDSLQAVIGARIDRLAQPDRSLVENAAVLGEYFTVEGLQILVGDTAAGLTGRLRVLIDADLFHVEDDPRSPERGQYRFVQSVIREVAYGRVTRADRRDRHLRVAEYFEGLGDPELAGAVAGHLMAARDAGARDESDRLVERALTALQEAAERAAALHSHGLVLSLSAQALEVAETDAARIPFWLLAARSADAAAQADAAYGFSQEAVDAAHALGDRGLIVRTVGAQGGLLAGGFRADEAVAALEPIYREIEEILTEDELYLASQMARSYMLDQRHEQAVAVSDRVLAAAEAMEAERVALDTLITRGTALGNLKRTIEAMLILRGAVELADRLDLPFAAIRALNNKSVVESFNNPAMAMETWRELEERGARLGGKEWYQAVLQKAGNLAWDGHFDEALATIETALEEDLPEFWQMLLGWRVAEIDLLRGPSPEGVAEIERIMSYWDDSTDLQMRALNDIGKAGLDFLAGDYEGAFQKAAAMAEGGGADFVDLEAARLMAVSAAQLRDPAAASKAVAALDRTGQVGPYAAGLRAFTHAVNQALGGDSAAAAGSFGTAIEILDRVSVATDRFITRATYAALIGPDHPGAATAAAEAQKWLDESGNVLFAQLFAAGLPSGTEQSETA